MSIGTVAFLVLDRSSVAHKSFRRRVRQRHIRRIDNRITASAGAILGIRLPCWIWSQKVASGSANAQRSAGRICCLRKTDMRFMKLLTVPGCFRPQSLETLATVPSGCL